MRKIILLCAFALLAACSKVPAGNVGVKAYLLGGEKGVDAEVLGPGRYWIGMNEELYLFPTFTQTKAYDQAITFQDVDGLTISTGLGLTYSVDKSKIALLFQKYRRGVDEITDVFLFNMIRDALKVEASTMKVDDIYGRGKEALIERVTNRVRKQVEPVGINIERIYWSGDMALPPSVLAALNAKIAATQNAQKVENQLRTAEANAKITLANAEAKAQALTIAAEAEAKANREVAASVSPELVKYIQAKRWDGRMPTVSGGATPIVDLR